MRKKIFALLIILSGCSPSSLEEYQVEGENIARAILKHLEKVESVSDLVREGPKLKKEYALLVQVMIQAKKYQGGHPNEEVSEPIGVEVSDALKKEFMRVYQLEGCQEVMEGLQRESLHKLDLFHRRLQTVLKIETPR